MWREVGRTKPTLLFEHRKLAWLLGGLCLPLMCSNVPRLCKLEITLLNVLPQQAQNALVEVRKIEYQSLLSSISGQQQNVNAFEYLEHAPHGDTLGRVARLVWQCFVPAYQLRPQPMFGQGVDSRHNPITISRAIIRSGFLRNRL